MKRTLLRNFRNRRAGQLVEAKVLFLQSKFLSNSVLPPTPQLRSWAAWMLVRFALFGMPLALEGVGLWCGTVTEMSLPVLLLIVLPGPKVGKRPGDSMLLMPRGPSKENPASNYSDTSRRVQFGRHGCLYPSRMDPFGTPLGAPAVFPVLLIQLLACCNILQRFH